MNTTRAFVLAVLLAATNCLASEPPPATALAGVKAEIDSAATDAGAQPAEVDASRSLRQRYPARPSVFHADGSVSQYVGATHLMQTVVRLDADGKLEKLCTTDTAAVSQFVQKQKTQVAETVAAGESQ